MQLATEISGVLRQLRSKLKLSQEELAARLNVSFATVNRWENGKSQPQGAARDAINNLLEEVGDEALVLRSVDEVTGDDHRPRAAAFKSSEPRKTF